MPADVEMPAPVNTAIFLVITTGIPVIHERNPMMERCCHALIVRRWCGCRTMNMELTVRKLVRHASRIMDSMFSGNIRGVTLALSEQIGLCATRRRNRAVMPIPWVLVRFDLRCGVVACKLFTCCRSAWRVPSSGWFPVLLVWWWFENSRACLYYFFIVNDCQFIPRLIACRGGWVPGRV